MVDFSRIPTRHDAINLRLEHWAKWVSVHPQPWKVQPMFRQYRSHSWQWHEPEIKVELNTIECCETEKLVSQLPEKHRSAIRWAYVYPFIHAGKIQRELGVTLDELNQLLDDARDMLKNRLQLKMRQE